MAFREPGGARILADFAETDGLSRVEHGAEEAATRRRRPHEAPLLGRNAAGDEAVDPRLGGVDGERSVPGIGELAGAVDDLLQHEVEVELARDVERRLVQREELGVSRFERPVEVAREAEDQGDEDRRAGQDRDVENPA